MKCMHSEDILNLALVESKLSIEQAIDGTQIRAITLIMGEAEMIKSIAGYLQTVADFFNVQSNLTRDQAIMTAGILIEMHPLLTIQDVMVAMKEAKAQIDGYKKPYGMIDGSVIFGWINTYIDRKHDKLDQIRADQKAEEQNEWYEAGTAVFEKLAENPNQIGKEKKPELKTKAPFPSSQEKFEEHVRATVHEYTKKQIAELIKRLHRQNIHGAYNDLLQFLREFKEDMEPVQMK